MKTVELGRHTDPYPEDRKAVPEVKSPTTIDEYAQLPPMICNRLHGGSVRDCGCCLPGGGWELCPPEARRVLPKYQASPRPPSGDFCGDCGSTQMVRTGTCLTCQACGSSSGGCS